MTTGSREHPILFSAPMVRAILAGTKTQTRRVVKPGWLSRHNVGDRLWVRETWGRLDGAGRRIVYRADGEPGQIYYPGEKLVGMKWKPSIFLRRSDSRITLEVTGVRAEKLQDISAADAVAEGINPSKVPGLSSDHSLVEAYRVLWDEINGKRASWESNPLVWVIWFVRVKP